MTRGGTVDCSNGSWAIDVVRNARRKALQLMCVTFIKFIVKTLVGGGGDACVCSTVTKKDRFVPSWDK